MSWEAQWLLTWLRRTMIHTLTYLVPKASRYWKFTYCRKWFCAFECVLDEDSKDVVPSKRQETRSTTRRHTPEDLALDRRHCQKLKSRSVWALHRQGFDALSESPAAFLWVTKPWQPVPYNSTVCYESHFSTDFRPTESFREFNVRKPPSDMFVWKVSGNCNFVDCNTESGFHCFTVHFQFTIYRVSQEERTIFWEVIVSVILSKKLYKNVCPIPNGFRDRATWLYSGLAWGPSIVHPSRPAVLCLKSNGSISETVRNRTYVHLKFFA
jgi:hypothetical protein